VNYPRWGSERASTPSPAPRRQVEWPTNRTTPSASRPPDPEPTARPAARPAERRYTPSQRVKHPVWGEGMVMNSKMEDNEEIVDVFFAGVGLKRLLASLANLQDMSGE